MRLLVDENMPRSTLPTLVASGHDAEDVRDVGLRGAADQPIFRYACDQDRMLVTRDLDFANLLQYPLGTHPGILVLRLPETLRPEAVLRTLTAALSQLGGRDLRGDLVIVEWTRVRVRSSDGKEADR